MTGFVLIQAMIYFHYIELQRNTEKEAYLFIPSKGKTGCSHQRARGWE